MAGLVDRAYVEILPRVNEAKFAAETKRGVGRGLAPTQRQLKAMPGEVEKSVSGASRRIGAGFDDTSRRAARMRVGLGGSLGPIHGFASRAATGIGLVGAGLVAMGGLAVKSGLQTAAAMEQANIAFTTLLGSERKSKIFLKDLSDFAARTPFELPGLIDASRQLLGAGLNAKAIIPTLTAFGDASGALGIQQEGFNRIMLATSQALAAGTLHAGDLLQMTEAGLPVWKLLSEALHKPVTEVKNLSEHGKLLTSDVLPKLRAQMEKDYGGAMIKQSQTISGLWSTLMDTFHQGMATALIPLEPMLRSFIPRAASGMGTALKKLGTGAADFFGGLSGNVKIMDQADRPKLQLFGLGLRALFRSFKDGDVTSTGFVGSMEKVGVALRGVYDVVVSLVQFGLDLLRVAWRIVGQILINFVVPILRTVGTFMKEHRTLVRSAAIAVLAFYAAWKVAQKIVAIVTAIRAAMIALSADPIVLIVAALAALTAAFIYAYTHSKTFRDTVDHAIDNVQHAFGNLTHAVDNTRHAIGNIIHAGGNFVHAADNVVHAGGNVVHAFGNVWHAAGNVKHAVDNVRDAIGALPGKIVGFFAGAYGWLTGAGRAIMGGLRSGIGSAWGGISDWFSHSLPGFFGRLGRSAVWWLAEGGKNIVRGLWNGIKALGSWVMDRIKSIIPGWIKTALGIKSPPQWAKDIGGWIAKGLAYGITHRFPHLIGNLAKMARDKLAAGVQASGDVLKMLRGATLGVTLGYDVPLEQAFARQVLPHFGWGKEQMASLISLWNNESGWNPLIANPFSGAYGIPQALPGSKMAAAGADWRTNAATQIMWGLNYIKSVYGSPANAWAQWQSRYPHWYGAGLPPTLFSRPTLIGVGESGSETVTVNRGDTRGGGLDYDRLAAAFARALAGLMLSFDADGVAQLVTRRQSIREIRGQRR